jgi:DNA repair ATPase RecN
MMGKTRRMIDEALYRDPKSVDVENKRVPILHELVHDVKGIAPALRLEITTIKTAFEIAESKALKDLETGMNSILEMVGAVDRQISGLFKDNISIMSKLEAVNARLDSQVEIIKKISASTTEMTNQFMQRLDDLTLAESNARKYDALQRRAANARKRKK